ncbi:MAG: hypothetical protein J6C64_10865 [Lachnospiraceae bacterium]|nr:hypothetical protein [Lachnospiraceae bacterium]
MKKRYIRERICSLTVLTAIYLAGLLFSGCGSPKEDAADEGIKASNENYSDETLYKETPKPELSAEKTPEKTSEKPDSFVLTYDGKETDIIISLEDCNCEYDKNGIQIYSKYISNYDWVDEDFPYFQYVFYIQTPSENVQIFPVKDFLINTEEETLYISSEISDFITMQEISFSDIADNETGYEYKIMNRFSLAELIGEAYQLSVRTFSDLHFSFTGIEKENETYIVKGEASGIHKPTGEKYYIDWKWNKASGEETAVPYLLTVYDEKKDRKVFEECEKAFECLKQGDWSMVEIDSDKEYLRGLTGDEWCTQDVNGDGLPELIGYFAPENSNIKQIAVIFAYQDDRIKMVLADVNDGMEYYFLCENGNLIYDSESTIGYGSFTQCVFDVKWERKDLRRLILYRFLDSYSEEEDEYLKKLYPDTYGAGGGGFYFYSVEPKTEEELKNSQENEYWTWNLISKEQFLEDYERMTGYNFLEESLYWADFLDGTYETLEACNNAFTLIKQGDWSLVIPFEGMENLTRKENLKWLQADVNGDKIPELLSLYSENAENSISPIEHIFIYKAGKVEHVFSDLNDYTEFFFIGKNRNLIYNYSNYGLVDYGSYSQYRFDETWDRVLLDKLEIYHFEDEEYYEDEEILYLKEQYPDTFGKDGSGFYFFRMQEPISKEQFLESYQQMTGFNFLTEKDWQDMGF